MSDLLRKEGPSGSGATKVYVGSGFPPLPGRGRIHTWSICFKTYIAAVGQKHPAMMGEMLAYMQQILRTQAEYEGQAWREYVACDFSR